VALPVALPVALSVALPVALPVAWQVPAHRVLSADPEIARVHVNYAFK
jgi:hypothetical protein